MARIIEYDERDRIDNSGGSGGGRIAIAVIVILFILYYSGYLPGFGALFSGGRLTELAPSVETVTMRSTGGVSYVIADNLNMRASPGNYGQVTYILPRGTRVELSGESQQEPDGNFWVQVRVETYEGPQVGWVYRRYIS